MFAVVHAVVRKKNGRYVWRYGMFFVCFCVELSCPVLVQKNNFFLKVFLQPWADAVTSDAIKSTG